jgi:hypothetical protein
MSEYDKDTLVLIENLIAYCKNTGNTELAEDFNKTKLLFIETLH